MKTKLLFLFMLLYGVVNAQWQFTSPSGAVYALAIKGDTIIAGTNGQGVFFSSNNGAHWSAVNTGLKNLRFHTLAIKNDTIFAGNDNSVFMSSNYGNSWDSLNVGLTINADIWALAINRNNIFAGTSLCYTNDHMFLSSNNGSSWINVGSGLNIPVQTIVIKNDTIYAGGVSGAYKSSNNGNTWSSVNVGFLPSIIVNALAIKGNNIFAGTQGNGIIYLSTNNGISWDSVNTGFPANTIVAALAVKGASIFAGTFYNGVFMSTNNGSSWTNIGLNGSSAVMALAINDGYLIAGTNYGVYRRPLTDLEGIQEINNNENNIAVYPNPTTNNITIESPQPATLEISNIQGQLIKTLATTGNKTNIDISMLAKGIYFVKVRTEKGVAVKKFIKE